MARADDKMPDVGALFTIMRGPMREREIVMHSEFEPKLVRFDPIEDKEHNGSIWRVLSLSAWPMALCALEWHPSIGNQPQLERHWPQPQTAMEVWQQERLKAIQVQQQLPALRGIINMRGVQWRVVPDSHLAAALGR